MINTNHNDTGTVVSVKAGFPNASQADTKRRLSLDKLLIKHASSTFFMRSGSNSLRERGIHTGDILIVDRSLEMRSGDVVVVGVDGDLCLRQYLGHKNSGRLITTNGDATPVEQGTAQDVVIWGVVTHSIRSHRGG